MFCRHKALWNTRASGPTHLPLHSYLRGSVNLPPSAPERTLQASGQGQAIARPQGRPTLLLRACTIYALGGEWREPAAEYKLCVPVPRQAHTRTRAYVCNLMRSPGEEILRKAGCRRERTIKRLQHSEADGGAVAADPNTSL